MRALLVQPPVYDTQYYAEWSMPSGLLKVASWLRGLGYDLRLIDCLYPSRDGEVKQEIRKVVQVCSTLEWNLATYREMTKEQFGRSTIVLPPNHRYKFEFGMSLRELEAFLRKPQPDLFEGDGEWTPDEIWITSIMTYWWESTRDTVLLMKKLYPTARIRIGGIYPTLSPNHLRHSLAAAGHEFALVRGRDLTVDRESAHPVVRNGDSIVTGEIPEASTSDLDFEGYRQMTRAIESEERLPNYAILTTSRGCPFDCSYCAQKAYNEGSLKVRIRSAKDTFEEIRDKYHTYGVRHVAFYEDNFLLEKPNVERLLRLLLEHRSEMPHLRLYAPEGIEVRLLHEDLNFVKLMRDTGFESVYLPLETMSREVTRAWNRRHSHAELFEKAVKICHEANFKLHEMEVNAFILFGMPDENLQDVVNTMFYASQMVGGIVPMLFTPVPGSIMYEQFEPYLMDEMGFDLHHLNGKLYPFLKYNYEKRDIRLSDYVALESLAFRLNAKTMGQTFPLDEGNAVYRSLRSVLAKTERNRKIRPIAKTYLTSVKVLDMHRKFSSELAFDSSRIVDAPEHHGVSRAMGVLTWGTWDHGVRPFEQRLAEFLAAFPPRDPVKNTNPGLSRRADGFYGPATRVEALDRFLAADGRSGSLHEILARYGLKLASTAMKAHKEFSPGDFRETARRRNQKLRALHGGVDIEPQDMDAAKAEILDKTEKKLAAEQIREARKRMKGELTDKKR